METSKSLNVWCFFVASDIFSFDWLFMIYCWFKGAVFNSLSSQTERTTVAPRYNEPRYNEPRYNEPRYNEDPVITNNI